MHKFKISNKKKFGIQEVQYVLKLNSKLASEQITYGNRILPQLSWHVDRIPRPNLCRKFQYHPESAEFLKYSYTIYASITPAQISLVLHDVLSALYFTLV